MDKRPVPGPKDDGKGRKVAILPLFGTFPLFPPLWPPSSILRVFSPKSETSEHAGEVENDTKQSKNHPKMGDFCPVLWSFSTILGLILRHFDV